MNKVDFISAKIVLLAHFDCLGCRKGYLNKALHDCCLDSWYFKVSKYFTQALKNSNGPTAPEEIRDLFMDVLCSKIQNDTSDDRSTKTAADSQVEQINSN